MNSAKQSGQADLLVIKMNRDGELDPVGLRDGLHLHVRRRTEGNTLAGDGPAALKELGGDIRQAIGGQGKLMVLRVVEEAQFHQVNCLGTLDIEISNHHVFRPRREETPSRTGGPNAVNLSVAEADLANDILRAAVELKLGAGTSVLHQADTQVRRRPERRKSR